MDYQNGKIYRIDCLTTSEVYIGSTCQPTLAKRLAHHKYHFNQWKKDEKGFISSFPIIERDNYQITMIELYPCTSRDELHSREGFYIRSINCVNKLVAGRTSYEQKHNWYEKNKDRLLEERKHHYEANKEQIAEQKKHHYEANKTEILARQKELREANREALKIKRDANKDQINARRREQKRLKKLQIEQTM